MAKHRLTKKQHALAKREAQREEALRQKLSAALKPKVNKAVAVNAIPTYEYDDSSQARSLPSAKRAKPILTSRKREYDDPELAAREALAQKEIERKKKRLAPAYNKGPYMLITDDTDPASLGRKN